MFPLAGRLSDASSFDQLNLLEEAPMGLVPAPRSFATAQKDVFDVSAVPGHMSPTTLHSYLAGITANLSLRRLPPPSAAGEASQFVPVKGRLFRPVYGSLYPTAPTLSVC